MNSEESKKDVSNEITKAELVSEESNIDNPTGQAPDFSRQERASTLQQHHDSMDGETGSGVPVASKNLWDKTDVNVNNFRERIPYEAHTKRVGLCLLISVIASIGFLIWFFTFESGVLSTHRAIILRYSLCILLAICLGTSGIFRIQPRYVPLDCRWLAWSLVILTLVCFLLVFPMRWYWVCFVWALLQVPAVCLMAYSPKRVVTDEKIQFNINESVAANGGSIAALVLGIWAMLGSLLTPFSAINGLLGITLGIWGLSSRKKSMAVFGICLCIMGILSCMLNVTTYFWEMITIPEEELMNAE